MSSDPLEERKILIDVYSAQVRAHSQNFLAVTVSIFSAVVAWVQIRSVEKELGRGLILGFNVATPFLLASVSVLGILALYMVGRTFYWSYLTDSAMRVDLNPSSSDSAEKQKPFSALESLENSAVNNVKKKHRWIYFLFKHDSWGLWAWFGVSVIIYCLFLIIFGYCLEFLLGYLVVISITVILEVRYWRKHYYQIKRALATNLI